MSDFISVPISRTTEVQPGLLSFVYIFLGGIPRGAGSKLPTHAFSLNSSEFDIDQIQRTASAALSRGTIHIANNTLDTETVTITIDGVDHVYTFKDTPSGDEIDVGADAAGSATNLKTALDGDDLDITIAISTDTVTVSSATHIISLDSSDGAKIVVADTSTAGAWTLDLPSESDGVSFAEATQHVTEYPMLINGQRDFVCTVALVPANATYATTLTRIKAIFGNALQGTAPTSGYGYVFSLLGATRAQISTAMKTKFGAVTDTAFVIASQRLTMQLDASQLTGLSSNFEFIRHGIYASKPDVSFTIDSAHQPILSGYGPGLFMGTSREVKSVDAPATVVLPQDTAFVDEGTYLTGLSASLSVVFNRVHNQFLQWLAAGSAQRAFDANRSYVMAGGGALTRVGVMVLTQTTKPKGQYHVDALFEAVVTAGRNKDLGKAAVAGLPITFSPLATDTADPVGFTGLFRQVAQA